MMLRQIPLLLVGFYPQKNIQSSALPQLVGAVKWDHHTVFIYSFFGENK